MTMNKTTKIVLIGLGVVAVGATAYFLLKPKSVEAESAPADTAPSKEEAPKKGAKLKKIAKFAIPAVGVGILANRAVKKRRANKTLDVV